MRLAPMLTVQSNPDGRQTRVTSPPNCWEQPIIKRSPNPLLWGSTSSGPSSSLHSISARPSAHISQVTASRPSGTESDPYFTAFVVSSWTRRDRACAAWGTRIRSGPLIVMRANCLNGENSALIKSLNEAPVQALSERTVWARATASIRPIIVVTNVSRSLKGVCRTSD